MEEPFIIECAPPSITSPSHFSQVPNEILAKIFTAGTKMWIDGNPSGLPFPDLVSAVCKHWRLLSHSTPGLWTFIVPSFDKDPDQRCVSVSKWLERSKAMLITFVLDNMAWTLKRRQGLVAAMETVAECLTSTLVLLEECAHRIRRLDIRLPVIPLSAVSRIISKTSQLQQLSLCQWCTPPSASLTGSPSLQSEFYFLQQSPNLIKLRLQGLSLPCPTYLTSLEIHKLRPTYSDMKTLFGTDCHLKYLVLHDLCPMTTPIPAEHVPIRVNSLCSIAVRSAKNQTSQGKYVFYILEMPNVTYLELDCDVPLSVMFGKSLSVSKVETLKLLHRLPVALPFNLAESNEDLQILQSFRGLQHLELTRVSVTLLLAQPVSEPRKTFRKRSIGSRLASNRPEIDKKKSTIAPPMIMIWPEIRSIVLDTVIADDVASLIGFIQCHNTIHTVQLSMLAMRHLSGLKRKGDTVLTPPLPWLVSISGLEGDEEGVTQDVYQWLCKLVDLKLLVFNDGLLHADADVLSDMP